MRHEFHLSRKQNNLRYKGKIKTRLAKYKNKFQTIIQTLKLNIQFNQIHLISTFHQLFAY